MVEELLAARGIIVSHETVRQWARKFGQRFANQIRRRLPRVGDKWHLDEVALKIAGVKLASRPRSSVMPSGSTSASRAGCAR
jgi:putative transposase